MASDERIAQLLALVDERGFVSVKELSERFEVSEVTIRRDLQRLHDENRLQRTYGGAVPLPPPAPRPSAQAAAPVLDGFLTDRVDVLIATPFDPRSDNILCQRTEQKGIPIIAESLGMAGMTTMVSVDNFQAGQALGRWAGQYVREHLGGQAYALDLTYHLSNTQARSQGFAAGLQESLPSAEIVLSINAQASLKTAYQLTTDAIHVYPHLNLIFAINDISALGAIQACRDLGLDPTSILVLTFGVEGDSLKQVLLENGYCKAGLAMFPEIVGPVCIKAAIGAYNHQPLPAHLVTPYAILTTETLTEFYIKQNSEWVIRWERVRQQLELPINIEPGAGNGKELLPDRIAFVTPFSEHEWYKSLVAAMQVYTKQLPDKVILEVVDAAQTLKDEVTLRKRSIAHLAVQQIQPGDVILIDGGQVTTYLAEELVSAQDLTVITNSVPVFDILRQSPQLTLVSTGGLLRQETQTLIGPTVETVLRELRVDKLFLSTTGASLDFGLSHTNIAEVTIKQAMIRAAREVILLADHTKFDQESVVQVASLAVVDKLITDNVLPASIRLELTKLGVEIILAKP